MKIKIKKISLLIALLFAAAPPAFSQWAILKSDADSLVRQGADYIYNIEFDKAHDCFQTVIERYPRDPAGYFLDAMIDWWKILLDDKNEKYDAQFLAKIDKVVQVCDVILDSNLADINALFFKGGALGYKARFYAQIRKSYISAVDDGVEGFNLLKRCIVIAPTNHDVMLGTGIYNYFSIALQEQYSFLKPVMQFFPKGDKEIGILQLKAAGKSARYASIEAKVVLLQLMYQFEKNYNEALQVSNELHTAYPNNPYFHKYLGRCYASIGDLINQELVWRDILNRFIEKKFGYDNKTAREAMYYIGTSLMHKGEWDMALRYFYKCDEVSRLLDSDGPSAFMALTNLRIGKIYDKQGKRKYALMQYEKVLKMKPFQSSHDEAKRYSANPYK